MHKDFFETFVNTFVSSVVKSLPACVRARYSIFRQCEEEDNAISKRSARVKKRRDRANRSTLRRRASGRCKGP